MKLEVILSREVAQARHEVIGTHSVSVVFKAFTVEIIKIYRELQRDV